MEIIEEEPPAELPAGESVDILATSISEADREEEVEAVPIKGTSSSSSSSSSTESSESKSEEYPSSIFRDIIRKKRYESKTVSQALHKPTGKRTVFESDEEEEVLETTDEIVFDIPADAAPTPVNDAATSTTPINFTDAATSTATITAANAATSTDLRITYSNFESRLNEFDIDLMILKSDLLDLSNDLKGELKCLTLGMGTMKEFFDMAMVQHANSVYKMLGDRATVNWTSASPSQSDWITLLAAAENLKKSETELLYKRLQSIQEEEKLKAQLALITADRDNLRAENLRLKLSHSDSASDTASGGTEELFIEDSTHSPKDSQRAE